MIPDEYWRLLLRWFWLIGLFAAAGAAAGLYAQRLLEAGHELPVLSRSSASFDSSATLAVSHYVSLTGIVTTGASNEENAIVADYTTSLAEYARTPQFVTSLQQALTEDGIILGQSAIENLVDISASPGLSRIDVHAATASRAVSESLVSNASNLLVARAEAEEDRLIEELLASLEQRRQELVTRLETLTAQQQAILVRPSATPGERFVVDLELAVVGDELKKLTRQRERLVSTGTDSQPLVLVNPVETVGTEAQTLAERDMLLLGGLVGLVLGWVVSNLAESIRSGKGGETTQAGGQVEADEARSLNLRLLSLTQKAAEVERRAKALSEGRMNGSRSSRERTPDILRRSPPSTKVTHDHGR